MKQFDSANSKTAVFTKGKVIVFEGKLYPENMTLEPRTLWFALDTGATSTHISKALLNSTGYSDSIFSDDTKESLSVTGPYTAKLCCVRRLGFLGMSLKNLSVKVWDPPGMHHVHGIAGMDLLRFFNIYINMDRQIATFELSEATKSLIPAKP